MNLSKKQTFVVRVYVAGPQAVAEQICREYCMTGLCVTVEPTKFIYTGGEETGVVVGLLNYPRFPAKPTAIWNRAKELAALLVAGMHQHSALVVGPKKTLWMTRRCTSTRATTP